MLSLSSYAVCSKKSTKLQCSFNALLVLVGFKPEAKLDLLDAALIIVPRRLDLQPRSPRLLEYSVEIAQGEVYGPIAERGATMMTAPAYSIVISGPLAGFLGWRLFTIFAPSESSSIAKFHWLRPNNKIFCSWPTCIEFLV